MRNLVGTLVRTVGLGVVNGFFFTGGSLLAKRLAKEAGLDSPEDKKEKTDTPVVDSDLDDDENL